MEDFKPINKDEVGLYCCGPTVYNFAHIGNLRTYFFEDILRRVLERNGYTVKHVMNVTDVGHLSDDGDDGEDKMIKSAREKGWNVWQIAEHFTNAFFSDIDSLHIKTPQVVCKATDHIKDMQNLISQLEEKGLTYVSEGNVYYDTEGFTSYGEMALLDRQELMSGARVDIDTAKKNPRDFVLWFTKSKFEDQAMQWESPWGKGYPGWHLECSAMSTKYLGEQFDIHCGGVDHIPVHHTNEIAQTEGATGKSWVNYWLHGEFLLDQTGKMSKSKGDFLTLQKLKDMGYEAMDYRYFLLGAHYRSQLIFTYESLDSAKKARKNLEKKVLEFKSKVTGSIILDETGKLIIEEFNAALDQDMNMPRALSVVWKTVKAKNMLPEQKLAVLYDMDGILGLGLEALENVEVVEEPLDDKLLQLIREREDARKNKDFLKSDQLRDELLKQGIQIIDTPQGAQWKKV